MGEEGGGYGLADTTSVDAMVLAPGLGDGRQLSKTIVGNLAAEIILCTFMCLMRALQDVYLPLQAVSAPTHLETANLPPALWASSSPSSWRGGGLR